MYQKNTQLAIINNNYCFNLTNPHIFVFYLKYMFDVGTYASELKNLSIP